MPQTREHKNEKARETYRSNALRIAEKRKAARVLRTKCRRGHNLLEVGFYEYISKQKHRVRECKACSKAKRVRRASQLRENHLQRKFGITLSQYDEMLANQNGRCAVCETDDPRGMGAFHVDHDHITGNIRKLLCMDCNRALGAVNDSADILDKLAAYIREHSQ